MIHRRVENKPRIIRGLNADFASFERTFLRRENVSQPWTAELTVSPELARVLIVALVADSDLRREGLWMLQNVIEQ